MTKTKLFFLFSALLAISMSFALSSHATPALRSMAPPEDVVHCGNPIGLNVNITNQPLKSKRKHGIPFVAKSSGEVRDIHWWARWQPEIDGQTNGYSAGEGGWIEISLYEDSGGLPADSPMAPVVVDKFELISKPPQTGIFRVTDLRKMEATVTKGKKYWIVFRNVHKRPSENFLSLNGPFLRNDGRTDPTADSRFDVPPRPDPNDKRAFHIARPCDDFYLFTSAPDPNSDPDYPDYLPWKAYQEDGLPEFVVFPFAVVRVRDAQGDNRGYGFPFAYGPIQMGFKTNSRLDDLPPVGGPLGSDRVRQTATFEKGEDFPIRDGRLKFFAKENDQKKTSKVTVRINDVVQGRVEVGELGWYEVPLDTAINADQLYEIEFSAEGNSEVFIMGAPMTPYDRLGYLGSASVSTDGGKTWSNGYPYLNNILHSNVQLCWYIEGTPDP